MKIKTLIAATATLVGVSQSQALELVTNGGFEEGPTIDGTWSGGGSFKYCTPNSWTAENKVGLQYNNNLIWCSSIYAGNYAAFLQGNGSLFQTINFPVPGTYRLSFAYVSRGTSFNNCDRGVWLGGNLQVRYTVWNTVTSWNTMTKDFTVTTSGSQTLAFGAYSSNGDYDCSCIDAVSVQLVKPAEAVTECTTWRQVCTVLEAGGNVKLASDVTQNKDNGDIACGVTSTATLDLNGHTLYQVGGQHLFGVNGETAKLTVTDSSAEGTGAIVGDYTEAYIHGRAANIFGGGEFVLEKGLIRNFNAYYDDGEKTGLAAILLQGNSKMTMNGGTIEGCKGNLGGAVCVSRSSSTFTMNGGTIANCTAPDYGSAVYAAGAFTMNGGVIKGCETTHYDPNVSYGGAVRVVSGGTFAMYGGELINNKSGDVSPNFGWGSAINVANDATSTIYGGVITNNTSFGNGPICNNGTSLVYGGVIKDNHWTWYYDTVYDVGSVYGGVFDRSIVATVQSGKSCVQVGNNWVVGAGVAQGNGQLTGGTYTFCPTNAEYVAAGVVDATKVTATGSDTSYTLNANGAVEVESWAQLDANLSAGNSVKMMQDMTQTTQVFIYHGKSVSLDLNGHTILCNSGNDRFFLLRNGAMTVKGSGVFDGNGKTYVSDGHFAYLADAGTFTLTIEDGVTIQNMKSSANGGAIYVRSNGTLVMNGGTIANCTVSDYGSAVYAAGAFTMNGGVIKGCETTHYAGDVAYGGAVGVASGGTFTMNAGELINNKSGDVSPNLGWGSAINIANGGTSTIYGGVITNNTSFGYGPISNSGTSLVYGGVIKDNHWTWHYDTDYRLGSVYGGVFDRPIVATVQSGKSCVQVGNNYVVGANIAQIDGQLTGGTYTFCPANAEYAAEVAVAPWVDMTTDEEGEPQTWTLTDNTTAIDVGTSAKARMKDGACWITGSGETVTNAAFDATWASVRDVRITDGVTGVGSYFFHKFYNLTNVTVAASCRTLGAGALFRCLSLEQVTFEGDVPTRGENSLVVHAAIRMEGDTPVVYPVPNVTVNGEEMSLMGSNDLQTWEKVADGEEADYHFFKFVAGQK